jgi:hypothetical protein
MKLFCLHWSIMIGLGMSLQGEPVQYFEAERGPHHKTWKKISLCPGPAGREYWVTNTFVELATGLHFWNNHRWMPSRPEMEILQDTAVARQGQHQAILAANLNSPGALDLQAPDGKRLRSHVLGLAYSDAASGRRVWIATVQDCQGAVLPPNQAYYQDAFAGYCRADVRYTYSAAGLEQDVILRQAPPSPAAWKLDPTTTCLEVFTEFLSPPSLTLAKVRPRPTFPEEHRRSKVNTEPEQLADTDVDFGSMHIGAGQVFLFGEMDPFAAPGLVTAKRWEQIDGRTFLIEQVSYPGIESWLGTLPQTAAPSRSHPQSVNTPQPASWTEQGLLSPPSGWRGTWSARRWAQALSHGPAVVIDYFVSNSALTNFTFQTGLTYLVSGKVQLYGTTVIEGGTVVKYGQADSPQLEFNGPVDCRTGPWHPAVFTARDDDTVGEVVTGSTGRPQGAYALYALACRDRSVDYLWHDLRIRYARYGLAMYQGTRAQLRHAQIGQVECALAWQADNHLRLGNFLLHDARYAFGGFAAGLTGQHGTIHRVFSLLRFPLREVALTNSLLAEVTRPSGFLGSQVAITTESDSPFQSSTFGFRYLAEQSPHRNAGTPFIDPTLRTDLEERTTDPPVALSGLWSPAPLLDRQARRDTDALDLGYHYDPLDFILRGVSCRETILTVTNGAVIGLDDSGTGFGLRLLPGASLLSEGRAERRNRFVHWSSVQEGPGVADPTAPLFLEAAQGGLPVQAWFRFTDFPMLNGRFLWKAGPASGNLGAWTQQDCCVLGGRLTWASGPAAAFLAWTNNLWDQVDITLWADSPARGFLWNNLFSQGALRFAGSSGDFLARDNMFHQTDLASQAGTALAHDYNGYLAGYPRWLPAGGHDVLLPSLVVYSAGPLGRFYYPPDDGVLSRLLDQGSRPAVEAGLYHFTTTTDQRKENISPVDIGFHYPACESDWPKDTDEDGLADYIEDANGNGKTEEGETDYRSADTDGDTVGDYLEWSQGRSPTRAGVIEDVTGTLRLEVYTPLE